MQTGSRSLWQKLSSFGQSIFTWQGIPLDAVSGGNVNQNWFAESLTTGQHLTVAESAKLSAVWACTQLIAGNVSCAPLQVYQKNRDQSKTLLPDHPIASVIGWQPNSDMTAVQFWETFVSHMLLWGDGFAWIHRLGKRIVSLELLLPQRLTRTFMADGTEIYKYTGFDGVIRDVPEKDILRVPNNSFDGINGLSVIAYASDVFGMARASGEAAGKMFKNGMRPSGALTVDKFLTQKQRDDVRENILPNFSGSVHSGKTLVLEGGMKFDQMSISPVDAEVLASRNFSVEEICRWFAVPPFMIGHLEKTTSFGTGIEQQQIAFRQFCLQRIMRRIEQAIERRLLAPGEQYTLCVEHDADASQRMDSVSRATFGTQMVNNGIYTRNEIRRKERLPDIDGADKLTVLGSLTTLDKVGEIPPTTGGLPSTPGDAANVPEDPVK